MGTVNSRISFMLFGLALVLLGFAPGETKAQSYLSRVTDFGDYTGSSVLGNASTQFDNSFTQQLISVGYLGKDRGIRAGYSGLILPGTCVSSYFVYNLQGMYVAADLPVYVGKSYSVRVGGSYLFSGNSEADQEITWLFLPPGVRQWAWSRSSYCTLQGDFWFPVSNAMSVVVGVRWESLSTNFGDPNPDYPFTIPNMESAFSLQNCQPYVGLRLEQSLGQGSLTIQVIGMPVMLASIQHFNTCNNAGEPFAHVGRSFISNGYFLEARGEIGLFRSNGIGLSAFLDWEASRGTCSMDLERRAAGPPLSITATTVDFLYDRSSFTVGGKVAIPFALPF
jgi:hypothetical protein